MNPIGGWDPQQFIGQRMTICTAGGPVPAVIARKAIHLLTKTNGRRSEDEGAVARYRRQGQGRSSKSGRIGDPVTLQLGYQEMRNNLANSPGMDNKTGLWVVIEALRRAKTRGG